MFVYIIYFILDVYYYKLVCPTSFNLLPFPKYHLPLMIFPKEKILEYMLGFCNILIQALKPELAS